MKDITTTLIQALAVVVEERDAANEVYENLCGLAQDAWVEVSSFHGKPKQKIELFTKHWNVEKKKQRALQNYKLLDTTAMHLTEAVKSLGDYIVQGE